VERFPLRLFDRTLGSPVHRSNLPFHFLLSTIDLIVSLAFSYSPVKYPGDTTHDERLTGGCLSGNKEIVL
jgi:hypothetical protein